ISSVITPGTPRAMGKPAKINHRPKMKLIQLRTFIQHLDPRGRITTPSENRQLDVRPCLTLLVSRAVSAATTVRHQHWTPQRLTESHQPITQQTRTDRALMPHDPPASLCLCDEVSAGGPTVES